MKTTLAKHISLLFVVLLAHFYSTAQDATVSAKTDARQIVVGDQVKLFLEVKHNSQSKLVWPVFPDTFNNLEIVEKGKIDTAKQGDIVTLKQRLLITGFDSGLFLIPSFKFTVIPPSGSPYLVAADSFQLSVQTVAVDTTQAFKPIKNIMEVKSSWMDYIWLIVGIAVFLILVAVVIIYFIKNKKVAAPVVVPAGPVETLQEKYLRLLAELEQKQLWQQGKVKEYYIELTDLLRNYIELRFKTPALELTTDEILQQARRHKEMVKYFDPLRNILETADLAKFAKAQPLPQEHVDAMEQTKQFINTTKPVITETPQQP
jgi:hypothetical protein